MAAFHRGLAPGLLGKIFFQVGPMPDPAACNLSAAAKNDHSRYRENDYLANYQESLSNRPPGGTPAWLPLRIKIITALVWGFAIYGLVMFVAGHFWVVLALQIVARYVAQRTLALWCDEAGRHRNLLHELAATDEKGPQFAIADADPWPNELAKQARP
jgi:hypothetical protein